MTFYYTIPAGKTLDGRPVLSSAVSVPELAKGVYVYRAYTGEEVPLSSIPGYSADFRRIFEDS
jgi:hypothetical protein